MPSARHADDARPPRRHLALTLLAIVLVTLAGAAAWSAAQGDASPRAAGVTGASPSPSTTTPAAAPSPSSSAAPTAPSDTAMTACRTSLAAAEADLAAERPAAEHWRIHVQAWHDVVDGRVPYRVAAARWKKTRLAGPGDLARFRPADAAYRTGQNACAAAVRAAAPGTGALARACADRQLKVNAAVGSGRAVLAEWAGHQRAMAAVRRHTLSDSGARVLFRAAVKKAPVSLKRFQRAAADAAAAPRCPRA